MKPKINVLENGVPVTREMTDAEYADYLECQKLSAGESEEV